MKSCVKGTHGALVLIRGLPGSGKSTLVKRLVKLLEREGNSIVSLDPDCVHRDSAELKEYSSHLTALGVPAEIHIYRYLCTQVRRGVESGALTIWDQPFSNREVFESLLRVVAAFDWYPNILLVELEIDPPAAYSRVLHRASAGNRKMPPRTFERYVKSYRSFRDLGLPTVTVDGLNTSEEEVAALRNLLDRAWFGAETFTRMLNGTEPGRVQRA